jgi:hypothetical protein
MATFFCGPGTRIIADPHRQKAEADAGRSRFCGYERGKNHKRVGCGFDRKYNLVIEGRPYYSTTIPILFQSSRDGDSGVFLKSANGTGGIEKLGSATDRGLFPWSWSKDGDTLVLLGTYFAWFFTGHRGNVHGG